MFEKNCEITDCNGTYKTITLNYVNLKLVNTTKYRMSLEDARKAASINQIYYQLPKYINLTRDEIFDICLENNLYAIEGFFKI